MASIFSKIIAGELPAHKVAETDRALAFLDINPLHEGHLLVVPKQEVDKLFDLPEEDYLHLWQMARSIARAQEQAISCQRVGVAVVGLEVPHAHIHLIPIHGVHDIDFSRPKLSFTAEQMQATVSRIQAHLPASLLP
ncbi:MAG: HIT family protein [Schleiferiaceae bacterium]|nr:HIT family protein [Schleiferiaceae bacterium]MDR9442262.1 HIT family protein [Schleiferiaceae bacterium]